MDDFKIEDLPSYIERLWNNLITSQVPTDFGNVTYYGLLRDALLMVKKLAETWTQKSADFDTQIKHALDLIDSAQSLLDSINIDVQQIRADVDNALKEVNDELDRGLNEINNELYTGLKNILDYVKTYLASDEFSGELDSKITTELTPYFEKINNSVDIMGDYEIVDDDPVQIRFRKGNGEYGDVIDLGDGLASKNMVNGGYYRYTCKMYSGASSDYGIEVRKIVGAYKQDGTPTPDNPVEPQFNVINDFYTSGKNVLNADDYYRQYKNGDVYTATSGQFSSIQIPIPKKLVGKKLLFSADLLNSVDTTSVYLTAFYDGSNHNSNIATSISNYTQCNLIFTPNSEKNYIKITYGNGIGTISAKNIMLAISDEVIPYTPYVGSSTTPVSLELRALPDGTADVWEDGNVTRNVAKVTFDGSGDESWSFDNDKLYASIILNDAITNYNLENINCLCNKLNAIQTNGVISTSINSIKYGSTSYNNTLYIRIDESITSLSELKTWLSQNPINVYYALDTPTTEPLAIPTLTSYYPFTNAWCDSKVHGDITWDILNVKGMLKDYLPKTDAESIYLSKDDASNTYLNKKDANNTYLSKTDAESTYVKNEYLEDVVDKETTYPTELPNDCLTLGNLVDYTVLKSKGNPRIYNENTGLHTIATLDDIPKIGRVHVSITANNEPILLEKPFPAGFSSDNCIIIGVGETYTSLGKTIEGIHTTVTLDSKQKIYIAFKNTELSSETVVDINILLMKLPDLGG